MAYKDHLKLLRSSHDPLYLFYVIFPQEFMMQHPDNNSPRRTLIATLAAIFMTGLGVYNVVGFFAFLLTDWRLFSAGFMALPLISLISGIGMITSGVGLLNRSQRAYPAAILINFWYGLYGVLLSSPGAIVSGDTSVLILPVLSITAALLLIADLNTREQYRPRILVNGQVIYPVRSIGLLLAVSYLIGAGIVDLFQLITNFAVYIADIQHEGVSLFTPFLAIMFCLVGVGLLQHKRWAFILAITILPVDLILAIFTHTSVSFSILGYTALNDIPNQLTIYSALLSLFVYIILIVDRLKNSDHTPNEPPIVVYG